MTQNTPDKWLRLMALPRNIPDWTHSTIFSLKSDWTFTQNIWIYSALLGTTIFWQIKMMCPMGAFCLQSKPNVAYEFAIFTGTWHSILQQDLNMQWIAKNLSVICWVTKTKQNHVSVCQDLYNSPTKPIIPSEAHCDFSLSETCAATKGQGISWHQRLHLYSFT